MAHANCVCVFVQQDFDMIQIRFGQKYAIGSKTCGHSRHEHLGVKSGLTTPVIFQVQRLVLLQPSPCLRGGMDRREGDCAVPPCPLSRRAHLLIWTRSFHNSLAQHVYLDQLDGDLELDGFSSVVIEIIPNSKDLESA